MSKENETGGKETLIHPALKGLMEGIPETATRSVETLCVVQPFQGWIEGGRRCLSPVRRFRSHTLAPPTVTHI